MVDSTDKGNWLLIDAAGPVSVIGIIRNGEWVAFEQNDGEFLEWLRPAIQRVMEAAGCDLPDLRGCIYGSGPGSTLGLRLAAMFLRGLLVLPGQRHWDCLQYNNLELVLAGALVNGAVGLPSLVAPWRRDRLHLARMVDSSPPAFAHEGIDPEDAAAMGIAGTTLGRRPPGSALKVIWHPYPLDRIPELLNRFPSLLSQTTRPTPYVAETPEFVQWNPKRHSGE
ncbi:MAG: hypothetical protein ACO3ZW_06550 [Opitutales bacterium]|jgi:tRNA A37 threonylcarbamoyladenosine modification protein TsaB